MSFIVVHNETGKYLSRKGISNSRHRLTDDIGAAQLFNKKGAATGTINIMHEDYERYRGYRVQPLWRDEDWTPIPSDGFTIHFAILKIGDPA